MSWGNITGEQQILPSGSNKELILEDGKPKKIRLALRDGEEPYSFFQHSFEMEKTENGQTVRMFRTGNCPKTSRTPTSYCPACDGQRAQRRIRHAAACIDLETGEEKILIGGEKIWEPIAMIQKMGVDPRTLIWVVSRTGKGRNDTTYNAVNIGVAPGPNPVPTINVEQEYAPHTPDQLRAIVEGMGMSWQDVITPPPLEYPTNLNEALNHVIPNTKYKGQTMKQVWDTNRGMIEFFANSNRVSKEKAYAQVMLVALGGANIPGVPNLVTGAVSQPVTQPAPQVSQPAQQAQPAQSVPTTPATPVNTGASADRQAKINEINRLLQTTPKFTKGGYQVIMDTMKQASGGKVAITEFSDAELDKMLELCKA